MLEWIETVIYIGVVFVMTYLLHRVTKELNESRRHVMECDNALLGIHFIMHAPNLTEADKTKLILPIVTNFYTEDQSHAKVDQFIHSEQERRDH